MRPLLLLLKTQRMTEDGGRRTTVGGRNSLGGRRERERERAVGCMPARPPAPPVRLPVAAGNGGATRRWEGERRRILRQHATVEGKKGKKEGDDTIGEDKGACACDVSSAWGEGVSKNKMG